MARPLSTSDPYRGGNGNGTHHHRFHLDDNPPVAEPATAEEVETLRLENNQLRSLCAELEQALQDATANALDPVAVEERLREYEMVLDEKTETIRQLHQQLDDARNAVAEADSKPAPARQGPLPREDELLQLSEDLERERRQLQEDKQFMEDDMRRMELAMSRERAEMARQRNDLQRLNGEIRHELERLERNGALQSKMDELKAKLQDASTRRGASPQQGAGRSSASPPPPTVQPQPPNTSKPSFMGRFFGK